MKYRLLNFVVCPKCKHYPLRLRELYVEVLDREVSLPACEEYCGYKSTFVRGLTESPPCKECLRHEIVDGYLLCENCNEWYPIIGSIVIMHYGDLRPMKAISEFVNKYRDRLPDYVVRSFSNRLPP